MTYQQAQDYSMKPNKTKNNGTNVGPNGNQGSNQQQQSYSQNKYMSTSTHSPSPSQTFFKDKKGGQSLIGKKVLPGFNKKGNKQINKKQ